MRVKVDYISSSRIHYRDFRKTNPSIKITFIQWKNIIYLFNESFREYILETGDKITLPYGFGEFSINKKKRKRIIVDPNKVEHIGLPIDWIKTKEKGKRIYNFNYKTEGYFFGWIWFKPNVRFKHPNLWKFKPSRVTSRLLAHYLKSDDKYQHLYQSWDI